MSLYSKDRKCNQCGAVFEVYKNRIIEDWPDIPCPQCKSKDSYIMMGNSLVSSVSEGTCGNYETEYSSGVINHPNSLMGRMSSTGNKY
jgi:DNA-directed RNA polymerase subunit RPC12/RpoP